MIGSRSSILSGYRLATSCLVIRRALATVVQDSVLESVLMVGDFLHFAGWKAIEIVEVSDGKVHQGEEADGNSLQGFLGRMGMGSGRRDPLWVVRGVNEG